MTIKVGDRLPEVTFRALGLDGVQKKTTGEMFKGRKVALFAVPGAFTPTCSNNHLPSYVRNYRALRDKGIDAVAVTAVNDAFVMNAWVEHVGCKDKIDVLADGSAEFANAIGLQSDASAAGLGTRSRRYAMIVEDGVVTHLAVEEPGKLEVSSAEKLLEAL
jgi:peroxiredoxin